MLHPDPDTALHALRRRAEQRRQAAPPRLPADAPEDAQRIVQELQIHQVELEMQYEELLLAQTQAEISRGQYAELYDAAPVGYCTVDYDGLLRQFNHHFGQLLNQPARQLLGRRLAVFVQPTERGQLADFLLQLRAAPGHRLSCELSLCAVGNHQTRVRLEGVATPGKPAYEQEAGCHLVLLDVSEQHRATTALATSEARFRAAFEQSRDGMLLLENNQLSAVNYAALRLLGILDRSRVLGHSLAGFWPEVQPTGGRTSTLLAESQQQAQAQGWSRLELYRPGQGGTPAWDELSFSPVVVAEVPLLQATWRDITTRKLMEEQLRDSEGRLQLALNAAGTGVWSWDLPTDRLQPDARAQEIFGLAPGLPFALLQATIHPTDLPGVQQALDAARRQHSTFDLEHRLVRADGAVRHVALMGRFDYDEAGHEPLRLTGLVRDVTARRQTEEELSYKNRLLNHLLRHTPVVLARIGPDGCFREYAGPPLRRLGLADDELVGQQVALAFPKNTGYYQRVLAGEPVAYTTTVERAGQLLYLQVFGFFDSERQEAVLFGTDVTEAEHLKEEATQLKLRQQQEMHAAILTTQEEERRRIAEALHNGVGQLLYATRLHLDTLPPTEPLRASQDLLNEAIRATRSISFELTPPALEDFGLATALRELVKRIPPRSLAVALHLPDLGAALSAPLQTAVYRIVQELLNNAMKHAQAQEVFVSLVREDDQLHLSVEDDGIGFDATAPTSGHGIGLAGIRTRVGLLGGTFEVKSRPGRGTGFFLQLPVRS